MKICCQRRKLLEFMRENFLYIKSFFYGRQRGHWRGIDSRKLPSAEKTLGETKNFL